MTNAEEVGERAWQADKRDFVADCRDEVADERDRLADEREVTADTNEQQADEREAAIHERHRQLDLRAAALGIPPGATEVASGERAAAERSAAARTRAAAHSAREQRNGERADTRRSRQEATERRDAAAPPTGLALAFAEVARYLLQAENFDDILTRIAETAVATVSGCDMASVSLRDAGVYRTAAATHAPAFEADEAQYDANEGPCIDAMGATVVHAPSFPDDRWPALAGRPVACGVQAAVAYQLAAIDAPKEALVGSLNAYAKSAQAFDTEAQEIGLILASHGSVAVRAVREREALERLGQQLHEALLSRDVIGQAKGILMERLKMTPEDAFDALRFSSQRLNLKLRQIAEQLAETGDWETQPPVPPSS